MTPAQKAAVDGRVRLATKVQRGWHVKDHERWRLVDGAIVHRDGSVMITFIDDLNHVVELLPGKAVITRDVAEQMTAVWAEERERAKLYIDAFRERWPHVLVGPSATS